MRKINTKSQPVQVWVPLFFESPLGDFLLDLQRAYKGWQNEDRIWLMPDAKKIIRWKIKKGNFLFYEAIIPSKTLNAISIYHIDEKGWIYPSFLPFTKLKNNAGSSLYKIWLKKPPLFYDSPDSATILLPVIKNGKFYQYEKKELKIEPKSIIPFIGVRKEDNTVLSSWPPSKSNIQDTISPYIESKNFYGELKFEKFKYKNGNKVREMNVVSSEKEPSSKAIGKQIKWPKPFDKFFPDGGTVDLINQYACMKDCIRKIEEKVIEKATQEVERFTNIFTGDTESPLERASFLPKAITNKNALLVEAEFRFGIYAENFDELIKSIKFKSLAAQKVKIKRIYSWLGYFWWELYNDISSYKNIRFCKNCGNIIAGGRTDRIFCTKDENKKCFNERLTIRQKKSYHKKYNL